MLRPILLPMIALAAALPAQAQVQPMYHAGLAKPLTATLVVKDLRWSCIGDSCSAIRNGTSPDVNVCSAVARKLGPVTSFSAGPRTFDQAAIDKCNLAAGHG
ncbi:CC_3452 family protein [Edaphosphingomonas haloaromaticamans]|uniref:Uncharacterized protein n=1 Tax=Edaphosphingomonas haloaromaticamans TaxID=653954 RepID=A0A1S1H8G0_9SPHN|nr:hypothetical protein [Sphingomonas haloaromaticamans]OHT18428.1 hypothetical protein BHE75_00399 [Sphingomonas haloaromaticamans]